VERAGPEDVMIMRRTLAMLVDLDRDEGEDQDEG
jgi:hypothetical protein